MKHAILLLLLLFTLIPLRAQQSPQAEALFARFKAAATFDYRYPREKVYLHFDNAGYIEGDTLWYKAYVVRASSLMPTNLSRVLYVELLNADGQMVERQTLRIDSLGQADGAFALKQPVRAGFHEVRAYTREMTNWGEEACFSRVLPVFAAREREKREVAGGDYSLEQLLIPLPEAHGAVSLGTPRPYVMDERSSARRLTFYPEGGLRARGLPQQLAFSLTDGRGHAVPDTLQFFTDDGHLAAEATAEHEGMGSVTLPFGIGRGYAMLKDGGKKWPLPAPSGGHSLHAERTDSGLTVLVWATDSATRADGLLGLAVMNRERCCYFDTLTASPDGVALSVPRRALRGGVNRIELFGTDGASRASRLVWCAPAETERRTLQLTVKQNKAMYAPFEPAVVSLELHDADGRPVQTTVSVAVRDESGNVVADGDGGPEADLLLSSEVRGYIARPADYFAKDDAAHRRMLDLLLMVQGWTANTFSVMCDADTFRLRQPIEEHLILRGTLTKGEGKKQRPQAGCSLNLKMYSLAGGALEGRVRTDADGRFAFESAVDYAGPYIAQFTTVEPDGRRRWNRLALDRWFAPQPRSFTGTELDIRPFLPDTTAEAAPQTFEWEDTIPRRVPMVLGEAKVTGHNKYRGFTGTRYSWMGGEKTGMRHATKYYNIKWEVERAKDMGLEPGTIWTFLNMLDHSFVLWYGDERDADVAAQASQRMITASSSGSPNVTDAYQQGSATVEGSTTGGFSRSMSWLTHGGKKMVTYVNNERLEELMERYPEYYSSIEADAVSSVSVVTEGLADDAVTGKQESRTVTRYATYIYELPDFYRIHSRKKGVERRNVEGFTQSTRFYSPDYRGFDLPSARDVRRTLLWAPSVSTDADGRASLILFTNSRPGQRLDISVRGITRRGGMVR